MTLWMWGSTAWAGFAAGVSGGAGLPLDRPTASDPGVTFGLYAGWRQDVGPVHLQPELTVRYDVPPTVIVPAIGTTATLGGALSAGAYAHLGITLGGYPFPSPDAGLLVEAHLSKLAVGLRAGWAWSHPARYKCGNCPQPSEHWLQAVATAGVAF